MQEIKIDIDADKLWNFNNAESIKITGIYINAALENIAKYNDTNRKDISRVKFICLALLIKIKKYFIVKIYLIYFQPH